VHMHIMAYGIAAAMHTKASMAKSLHAW